MAPVPEEPTPLGPRADRRPRRGRRPRRPARPRADRGQHLPRRQPAGQACSGSSAARWPGRPCGRRPHRRARARPVHSLHAYFLRPGDPSVPILYEVDRIRDGRSFTTRRVVAIQHGKADLQPGGVVPAGRAGLEHQAADAGRARRPSRCPTSRSGGRPTPRSSATGTPGPGRSTSARRLEPRRPQAPAAAAPAGVAPSRRAGCPTTRCCTPASSPTRRT